eukprot:TRINITY_DN5999_c0_g1_i1.p1 TRINITY_DN5999_c0_g1~~TRINITY_DN5999_c0_g1_i1.p1  ORF type:complete len:278 (+),score=54.87 TRINITY_DN5999_c0_g1_i1:270-1103(+)
MLPCFGVPVVLSNGWYCSTHVAVGQEGKANITTVPSRLASQTWIIKPAVNDQVTIMHADSRLYLGSDNQGKLQAYAGPTGTDTLWAIQPWRDTPRFSFRAISPLTVSYLSFDGQAMCLSPVCNDAQSWHVMPLASDWQPLQDVWGQRVCLVTQDQRRVLAASTHQPGVVFCHDKAQGAVSPALWDADVWTIETVANMPACIQLRNKNGSYLRCTREGYLGMSTAANEHTWWIPTLLGSSGKFTIRSPYAFVLSSKPSLRLVRTNEPGCDDAWFIYQL